MRVGVFDSGVGGITVLEELLRALPGHSFFYYGDNANLPYGTKSPDQIQRLSAAAANALDAEGVDVVVVACGTASSHALPVIQEVLGAKVQVLGVVEPGARASLAALPEGGRILVMATRATVNSGAYPRAVASHSSGRVEVVQQACPLLVPMIEESWGQHPILRATLEEYLGPHLRAAGLPGVVLMGCTHYPWIQEEIQELMSGWVVVNSARAVAQELQSKVREADRASKSSVKWIFTDPQAIPGFAIQLAARLGYPMVSPQIRNVS